MNKERIKRAFLMLIPICAAGIACNPGSVMLYDAEKDAMAYCSYFALLPEGTFRMGPVLAGLLTCLAGGLSFTYLVGKKLGAVKGAMYISLAAVALSALPILVEGPIRVLPNVGVPILMIAHTAVAFFILPRKKIENKLKNK